MMSQLQLLMNKRQSEFLVKRMTDTETSGRYQLWMDSLDELMRNPLMGHGFGSDRWLAQGGHLDHKQRPHNWYIVIWHNTGFFGLLLLLATLAAGTLSSLRLVFSHADEELKSMSRLVTGQLLGLTATGLVDSMGSPSNIQTITLVLFLVAAGRLPIIYRQEQLAEAEAEAHGPDAPLIYDDVYAHQF
jgi:O-antigen ligase